MYPERVIYVLCIIRPSDNQWLKRCIRSRLKYSILTNSLVRGLLAGWGHPVFHYFHWRLKVRFHWAKADDLCWTWWGGGTGRKPQSDLYVYVYIYGHVYTYMYSYTHIYMWTYT